MMVCLTDVLIKLKQQTNSIQQCIVTGYNYNPSDVNNIDNLLEHKGIKNNR
jgi:hypothetical protein